MKTRGPAPKVSLFLSRPADGAPGFALASQPHEHALNFVWGVKKENRVGTAQRERLPGLGVKGFQVLLAGIALDFLQGGN